MCGTLGELYGWHYGFGAAGIGMVAGLLIYVLGARHLPRRTSPRPRRAGASATVALQRHELWQRVRVLVAIGLTVMLFRGAYEQVGNTIALWADTGVDRAARRRSRSR